MKEEGLAQMQKAIRVGRMAFVLKNMPAIT
jgi:hypothetical protein